MIRLRIALDKVNVWKVRVVALSFLVLLIGSGSQVLVNAMAAGTDAEATTPGTTIVISNTPATIAISTAHIHIRRAGVGGPGGYTATGKR